MADIIDEIAKMTLAEKRDLARALRAAIADELAASAGDAPERCPRCGCPEFVRKGRDASGAQRRLCRGCARTFGAMTMGLLGRQVDGVRRLHGRRAAAEGDRGPGRRVPLHRVVHEDEVCAR